ncbi:hypothetical protein OSB04_002267 [Centaurea solstitialis]|uniref:non-specific serine/threonine protein kinase n=1 Tax=Centaurea solstitialis TaxID=347529 RepID=A0AA38WV94_9ASTR|nr:hypothetical protein OSB04_002267 [Centaurea solstitialis]
MLNSSVYSRLTINSSGNLQRLFWSPTASTWNLYWSFPRDICDNYSETCGRFGICNADVFPVCKCLSGFRPRDEHSWFDLQDGSSGCVWSSKLDCGSAGFLALKSMKLPEGGSGCIFWLVDLVDMRQFAESENGGQDLYVRVAASDLEQSPTTRSSKNGSSNGKPVVMIVGIIVGICAGLITLLILLYLKRKNRQPLTKSITYRTGSKERVDGETVMDELDLPLFDFDTLTMATNNFSTTNELGEGGFGCVYKGTLPGGEVVAVKRLSRVSDQGIEELTNEIRLIAKLQHRNLVRLLGCCIEFEEKLLIYEFMKNRSLDTFLFGKVRVNFGSSLCLTCGYCLNLTCSSKE